MEEEILFNTAKEDIFGSIRSDTVDSAMEQIMKSINECNSIRYASYRTASKILIFHRALNMHYVQMELIAGIFERHRLSVTENSLNLEVHEIEDVLADLYFAAQKENNVNFDLESSSKLAINYLFKTFNKKFDENIPVLSVKIALTLLSCSNLEEKYGYLFHQLADHNACLSKISLNTLLTNICKITEALGESVTYGNYLIPGSIDKCFQESQSSVGVTEAEYASWLIQEPPILMWITTFNRMKLAENIMHNIKCSSCKLTPIKGPKYSCLKCAGYNQCQTCFLNGKTSNKHKLKHPVREYCIKTGNREITKIILEIIRSKLRLCSANISDPNTTDDISQGVCMDQLKNIDTISIRSTVKKRILNDPQKELQSIINHLEIENKQLKIELQELNDSRVEKLQLHRSAIESQLERLKILKNFLFTHSVQVPQDRCPVQSTPMVHAPTSRISSLPIAFQLSPIIHHDNSTSAILHEQDKNDSTMDINQTSDTKSQMHSSKDIFESTDTSPIDLSTWIGGNRTTFPSHDSGFSQWLDSNEIKKSEEENSAKEVDKKSSSTAICSKNKKRSSIKNIQGDLNEILDRLQNMVANDCLLEESVSADNNCELKRAATEMEDLLTGLIEGMESRKDKLTSLV